MMTNRRLVLGVGAAAIVLLAAVAIGAAYAGHVGPFRRNDPGPIVATVDGRPIYLADVQSRVDGLSTVHGNIQQSLGQDWHDQVMESLVTDKILEEEAERRHIVVTQQQISDGVTRVQAMFPSSADFAKWMDDQHLQLVQLEDRIRLQTLAALVYGDVTGDVGVTSEEIRSYYRSHLADYTGTDGSTSSLLEVRKSIRAQLLKEQQDQAFTAWLDARRSAAHVVILDKDWWRNIS